MKNNIESLGVLAPLRQGATNTNYILDSKHITATLSSLYDLKIVDCGSYSQVYFYPNRKLKKSKNNDYVLIKPSIESDTNSNNLKKESTLKTCSEIELRSIIRSKLACQRLAKCNIDCWETFITLTIDTNLTDVNLAYKRFKCFVNKVRRIKSDFKYLCVVEFQKRGAVHYHLLTNVNINDSKLIFKQEDNPKYLHIKYWIDGYTSVEVIKGDPKKIIGYIAKYMTKDIDNRLFNHRRYYYSSNLNMPKESYINLDNEKERDFFIKKIQDKELIYHNEYINHYDNSNVTFLEFYNQ